MKQRVNVIFRLLNKAFTRGLVISALSTSLIAMEIKLTFSDGTQFPKILK